MGAQTAVQSINEIVTENRSLTERNERLDEELAKAQQEIKEMKARLKKLEKFEGLAESVPPVWTFEIKNKILIASIMGCIISIKGRYANYPNAKTEELKERAKNIIDDVVETALIDTFMNKARFGEMVSRQKLIGGDNGD